MSDNDRIVPFPERRRKAAARRCPICGKAGGASDGDARHSPFCSARCKQIDLGRWLNGSYRVETEEAPDPGDATAADPGERSDG